MSDIRRKIRLFKFFGRLFFPESQIAPLFDNIVSPGSFDDALVNVLIVDDGSRQFVFRFD